MVIRNIIIGLIIGNVFVFVMTRMDSMIYDYTMSNACSKVHIFNKPFMSEFIKNNFTIMRAYPEYNGHYIECNIVYDTLYLNMSHNSHNSYINIPHIYEYEWYDMIGCYTDHVQLYHPDDMICYSENDDNVCYHESHLAFIKSNRCISYYI